MKRKRLSLEWLFLALCAGYMLFCVIRSIAEVL